MKNWKKFLWYLLTALVAGAAGFFVCYATITQPLKADIKARDNRAQEISQVLADSIAATEAWLEAEKIDQVRIAQESLDHFITRFGDNNPQADEARTMYARIEEEAKSERMLYMVSARRHIDWMKQEKSWIESRY